MPCPEYDELKSHTESFRQEMSYFLFNKDLHGQTERKAKEFYEAAREKMLKAQRSAAWHQRNCEACKSEMAK
jgi:hypothetical protein